jgi:hypothetical protein
MFKSNKQQNLIDSLLDELKAKRPDYVQSLGKGLTMDQISSLLSFSPVPDELFAIYMNLCGTAIYHSPPKYRDSRYWDFMPGYGLISIYDLQEEFNFLLSMKQEISSYPWKPDMIPLLKDFSGSYYCLRNLHNNHSIVSTDPVIGNLEIFPNLWQFIRAITQCYRQNIYYIDEDGWLDCDDDEAESLIFERYSVV